MSPNEIRQYEQESLERLESELAKNFPAEYSAKVDGDLWNYKDEKGVRHIVVRDMNVTQRYLYRNGRIIPLRGDIF